jgi:hypothetical protein
MSMKSVGEALTALGVIASLVFVGAEIRQSNAQAKAAAYQAIGTATAAAFDSRAHDPAFEELWLKDPMDMSPVEWQQLTQKFNGIARLGEMILLQIEQGVLDPDAIERLGYAGWQSFLDHPKLACLWPQIRVGVSPEFRALVEEGKDPEAVDCSSYDIPSPGA